MSKLYAVQCDPEVQVCDIVLEQIQIEVESNTMALVGNNNFHRHASADFEAVVREIDMGNLLEALNDLNGFGYDSKREAVNGYFVPLGQRGEFTDAEIEELHQILLRNWDKPQALNDRDATLAIMTILTGREWKSRLIVGCCQSDWQYMYYDSTMWTSKAIDVLECEYFNMGTEWCVAVLDAPPVIPSAIWQEPDCVWQYCHGSSDDAIRKELIDACDCACMLTPDDVVMYKFSGYHRTPVYEEV